jgi:hypothetical protein
MHEAPRARLPNHLQDRWVGLPDLAGLLVSGVAAAIAPLQVLLVAFAFLGPFHYLTEIFWLRRKKFYFAEGMVSSRVYVTLACAMAVLGFVEHAYRRDFGVWVVGSLLLLSLTVWVRNAYAIAAIAVAAIVTGFFLRTWVYFIAVMVPTLVHVFFFTWTFMLSGALRDKRATWRKWLNPALMVVIPVLLVALPMHYAAPSGIWLRAEAASFGTIHKKLAGDLHHTVVLNEQMLNDRVLAGMLRLFAFVYLFHYLNWFAKTELLEWHKVSRRGWAAIVVLYAASMGAYVWNFQFGFLVATFLSMLHVLLEFPLNWHTLRFLSDKVRRRRLVPAEARIAA